MHSAGLVSCLHPREAHWPREGRRIPFFLTALSFPFVRATRGGNQELGEFLLKTFTSRFKDMLIGSHVCSNATRETYNKMMANEELQRKMTTHLRLFRNACGSLG